MKKVLLFASILMGLAAFWTACDSGDTTKAPTNCKHDDATKIVIVEAKEPTCQENGLTEGKKCTLCDTMVVPQASIPTIECVEGEWVLDQKATAEEAGLCHTECTLCGKTVTQDTYWGSFGLSYRIYGDGTCQVAGIGSCTDAEIIIPSTYHGNIVTSIHSFAFEGNELITSVHIPDSVTWIGGSAFISAPNLTSVVIGKGVTSIDRAAFQDCSGLTSVEIPASVTDIGMLAFAACPNLSTIQFAGTRQQWKAINKERDWAVGSPVTVICSDDPAE